VTNGWEFCDMTEWLHVISLHSDFAWHR